MRQWRKTFQPSRGCYWPSHDSGWLNSATFHAFEVSAKATENALKVMRNFNRLPAFFAVQRQLFSVTLYTLLNSVCDRPLFSWIYKCNGDICGLPIVDTGFSLIVRRPAAIRGDYCYECLASSVTRMPVLQTTHHSFWKFFTLSYPFWHSSRRLG